jgi:hypothetical protein
MEDTKTMSFEDRMRRVESPARLNPDEQMALAKDHDRNIRYMLAKRIGTHNDIDDAVEMVLCKDEDGGVRLAVAVGTRKQEVQMEMLRVEKDSFIISVLVESDNLSADVQNFIRNSTDSRIRKAVENAYEEESSDTLSDSFTTIIRIRGARIKDLFYAAASMRDAHEKDRVIKEANHLIILLFMEARIFESALDVVSVDEVNEVLKGLNQYVETFASENGLEAERKSIKSLAGEDRAMEMFDIDKGTVKDIAAAIYSNISSFLKNEYGIDDFFIKREEMHERMEELRSAVLSAGRNLPEPAQNNKGVHIIDTTYTIKLVR